MKSLLIITSFLPYPIHSGGEQAQYNMIEALRKTYHIGIVFPVNRDNRPSDIETLSFSWPDVRFFPFPLRRQYSHFPFLFQKVRKFINRHLPFFRKNAMIKEALDHTDFLLSRTYLSFVRTAISEMKADVVQVEFIQNLNIGKYLPKDIFKLFVHHEIGFVITERTLDGISLTGGQQKKKEHKKQQEIARLNEFDGVVTLTETDKKVLMDAGVIRPVFVSPAAVNTRELTYTGWNGNIVFIGGFNHRPNHEGMDWFLSEVVPCIDWHSYPMVKLQIIGLDWPISYEHDYHGLKVNLLGYVEDLSEHAANSIMIVPILTGSGMRMKILDAAAMSVPFVSTTVGVEGLDFHDGESCLISDRAEGFAQALVRQMSDHMLRERIALNAHLLYQKKYSLRALVEKRKAIYQITS